MRPRARILPLLIAVVGAIASPVWADEIPASKAVADPGGNVLWYDIRLLHVEGRGWTDTKAFFDRLPARAEGLVRDPVWQLSRNSSGMCVRFATNATSMHARWTLTSAMLSVPHMPTTGYSGLDLYVKHDGKWRWLTNGIPTGKQSSVMLASTIPATEHEFLLYLPLSNGVSSVEIGLPKNARLTAIKPKEGATKPIVFYGTSITQGGCASRPGMVHTAILGRRLDVPVINLGFSGNGRMEPDVAKLLAELDPSVYVIDCLPNMSAGEVARHTEPLVRVLRKAHADTPILLVEDRTFANAFFSAERQAHHQASRAALRGAFDRLTQARVKNLHYLPGDQLLGDDGEATVDGSHPTDLGFLRMADVFEPALKPLLGK
ncbi:MAG: SGNH/GDSL hydrolase family protein [Pirellulales bacterium]